MAGGSEVLVGLSGGGEVSETMSRKGQHRFDLIQGYIPVQFNGKRLAVASHGTDTHALTINGDGIFATAQDFVGFGIPFPLFFGLPVIHGSIDPGDKAGSQRGAELIGGEIIRTQGLGDLPVKI